MAWALVVLKSSQGHSGVGRALKAIRFNAFHAHTQELGNYVLVHSPSMEACLCCAQPVVREKLFSVPSSGDHVVILYIAVELH